MTDSEYVSQVEIFFKDQQLRAEKLKSVNARVTNKPAGNLLIELNTKGIAKLTKNFDITSKEKPKRQEAMERPSVYQKSREQYHSRSGYDNSAFSRSKLAKLVAACIPIVVTANH
ncbi:Hypothetical predicted protein [Mytilus galloprovincialis]|uniref:Uncharacterized protein n=1 Tax=Mytilus galloprovincialis TaxID=29158 RepID=A0A8B6C8Z3_MYTGA|nr:Hypothetical predicted protein [Mytilus galloprovincialis]